MLGGGRCSAGALTTFPPQSTHNSVRRWCAPDEAFDLALLSMEGMLGLCAGDDGGSCWEDDIMLGMQEGQSPSWHPRLMGSEVYSPNPSIQQTFTEGLCMQGRVQGRGTENKLGIPSETSPGISSECFQDRIPRRHNK